jgi:hypothetical protein
VNKSLGQSANPDEQTALNPGTNNLNRKLGKAKELDQHCQSLKTMKFVKCEA